MGGVVSNLIKVFSKPTPRKVLMVGMDNAGKTTILYGVHAKHSREAGNNTTIPTVGFNVETIKIESVTITVWDIGGQKKLRTLWAFYADALSGLIYVIDIQDRNRWEEAVEELKKILDKDTDAAGNKCPVLILANKIDMIPESKIEETKESLVSLIKPNQLFAGRQWRLITCSAREGGLDGIFNGFIWLADYLTTPSIA
ncbi:hypothetical protein NEDG_01144 [Nematocida displodere]|uniref:Uncharacterized protein n=1 Tax=Nematocida displodere TaxID=1805483 RepID=A0A177EAQ6_9MICR|nr:hypothetical protein NEDG_01144 [Nematocida displodere]